MFFKKLNHGSSAYPAGYTAPPTDSYNTESFQLKIGAFMQEGAEIELDSKNVQWIQLRVQLLPLKIHHTGPLIYYEDHFIKYEPCSLYGLKKENYCHEISLVFKGVGAYFQKSHKHKKPILNNKLEEQELILPENNILYTHYFLTQEQGDIKLKSSLDVNQNQYIDPPGCINGYPVWTYGGYYRPGCAVEAIEQTYFSITQSKGITQPYLIAENEWKKKNIPIPQGKKEKGHSIVFMEKGTHPPNLAVAIENGSLSVQLCIGIDEEGKNIAQTYYSYDYKVAQNDCLDIQFKER